MPTALQDRALIHELEYAFKMAASLRAADPDARRVFQENLDAARALEARDRELDQAGNAFHACRVQRQQATGELREALAVTMDRLGARIREAARSRAGRLVEPALLETWEALKKDLFPGGISRMPRGVESLAGFCARALPALARYPQSEGLLEPAEQALAALELAHQRWASQKDKIAVIQLDLEAARTRARQARSEGKALIAARKSRLPMLDFDPKRFYPVDLDENVPRKALQQISRKAPPAVPPADKLRELLRSVGLPVIEAEEEPGGGPGFSAA